jgi:class 3 adenylate cyclase
MNEEDFSNKIKSYDVDDLKKYFDPVIWENLDMLTFSEIKWIRLTIAFWDLSGFSNLCNQLIENQLEIISFLKEYFDEGARVIRDHGGILDKFLGDGLMAYFGYPEDSDDVPIDALTAALEFRESFQQIKERYTSYWFKHHGKQIAIELKCGMHVGYVFFGLLETESRKQITVIGRNANLSSRLEGIAKQDEIIVSAQLKNIADTWFEFEEIKDEIKSFEGVETAYKLISKKIQTRA